MAQSQQSNGGSGSTTTAANPLQFESALESLQNTVRKLESGELSLEQSLQSFEEGVKLTRICQEYLKVAEQKVEQLIKVNQDGSVELKP